MIIDEPNADMITHFKSNIHDNKTIMIDQFYFSKLYKGINI